ncbi:hypothetical protein QBC46DRAFT_458212 [Diplogelasinospora grovesii]|uniref:DNA polymerase lambda n=1 Tax=Diplogelasinospora grovesii TaxID=303347 RepID=A0AAN6S5S5_9PEZI|nr:hypothetical protein QBC46DRAFT_458212 [Diplogelasinospora grovesii]
MWVSGLDMRCCDSGRSPASESLLHAIGSHQHPCTFQEKLHFFEALDALNDDDDDCMNEEEEAYRKKSRAFFPVKKRPAALRENAGLAPRRTSSAPSVTTATSQCNVVVEGTPNLQRSESAVVNKSQRTRQDNTSFVEDTPVPDSARPLHALLQRRTTVPLSAAASPSVDQSPSVISTMRKRKRQSNKASIPESEQVFRGLTFYFIPNNDVAPARKLRIGRAQEYGAKWIRDLSGATHVIVDKNLVYKDIESIVGCTTSTTSRPVVVNEEYPIDCISFKTLLNPDQNRYRVSGCPVPAPPASTPNLADPSVPSTPSQQSDESLKLKEPQRNPKRWDHVPRQGTPPRSEESSLQSRGQEPEDAVQAENLVESPVEDTTMDILPPITTTAPIIPSSESSPIEHPSRPAPPPRQKSDPKDELSEYIALMQQYKDLPLDEEDDNTDLQSVKDLDADLNVSSSSQDDRSSDGERARKRSSRTTTRSSRKEIAFEDRFACNTGGTKDASPTTNSNSNPNARTIEVLQAMCDYYSRINDHWRTMAYRKAISTLRRQTVRITTEDEAYRLPNVGRRLAQKIEEIVQTNRLQRLEYAQGNPTDQVLDTFLKVYGVGLSTANKWISQGYRTLQDLIDKADLTTNQRLGIEHYEDLNTRIPRNEVTELGDYVKTEARKIDSRVELLVGGSYRRGSESSGDIDFIVTKRGTSSAGDLVPFLEELIRVLTEKGFLVATLAALHSRERSGSKWHGCCVLPHAEKGGGENGRGIWRRIDFLLVPETEYGAALIYFTGNDIFNRSMRLLASKKGMRLNQRGLYREVIRGRGGMKVTEGELVEGRDEKRIFEILGVKWREPTERWC